MSHLEQSEDSKERSGNQRGPLGGLALTLVVALIISRLGDQMSRVALIWGVSEGFGGATSAALLGFALAIPVAIFSVIGGVIVDKTNHVKAMISSDLGAAAVTVGLAVFFFWDGSTLILVVLGAALMAAVTAVFMPALLAALPDFVDGQKEQLIRLDAWILSSTTVAALAGPVIGGLFLSALQPGWLLVIDSISFIVSAGLIWLASQRRADSNRGSVAEPSGEQRSYIQDILFGWKYLFSHPVLRPQFTVYPITDSALAAIPFVLPVFVIEVLGAGSGTFGLLLASFAGGRVLGNVGLSRTRLRDDRGLVLRANLVLQGLAIVLCASGVSTAVAAIALVLAGIPGGAAQVALSSYIQLDTPEDLRGRVFGSLISLVSALAPLGPLVFGTIASAFPRGALFAIGLVTLVGGIYIACQRRIGEIK